MIAAVGIGTVVANVHRVVNARPAATAEPAAPLPDTSAPQLNQTPEMAPPPIADGAVPAPVQSTAAAPADAAPAASNSQSSAAAPKAARQPSSATTHRSSSSDSSSTPPIAASAPKARSTGETAVVSANRKIETDQSGTAQVPASEGMLAGAMTGTAPAAASVADARDYASAGAAAAASGAPAPAGDEVTTTTQARAAGGDAATSDRLITDAVQSQLDADTASQGGALAVNTINGVVIMTGTVPNAEIVDHAKQVAQQVRGVKGVDATAVKVATSP